MTDQYPPPQTWGMQQQPLGPYQPQHRPPGRKKRSPLFKILIGIAGALALFIVMGVVAAALGLENKTGNSSASSKSSSLAGAVAAPTVTSTPTPTATPIAQQVAAWADNGGSTDMHNLTNALSAAAALTSSIEGSDPSGSGKSMMAFSILTCAFSILSVLSST